MFMLVGTALSRVFLALIAKVFDAATGELKNGMLTLYPTLLLAALLVRVVIRYTGSYLLDTVGERVIQNVRKRLLSLLHTLELGF
jgi:ABC-type multidrug transport system fused ATPase/permease subunit